MSDSLRLRGPGARGDQTPSSGGRDERIRTSDLLLPKQAPYQTGPHPEWGPESNRHRRHQKPLPYRWATPNRTLMVLAHRVSPPLSRAGGRWPIKGLPVVGGSWSCFPRLRGRDLNRVTSGL